MFKKEMNDSLLSEPQVFLASLVGLSGHLVHNVHVPTYDTMHGLDTNIGNLWSIQSLLESDSR